MIVQPDSLEHLVLYQADEDWLELGNPHYYAGYFENDLAKRKALLLAAIRSLADAGYLKIGQLERRDPQEPRSLDWLEWPGTLDDQMARLAEVYTPEVDDDDDWFYACWFNLTDAGQHVIDALPQPDHRFFEGAL